MVAIVQIVCRTLKAKKERIVFVFYGTYTKEMHFIRHFVTFYLISIFLTLPILGFAQSFEAPPFLGNVRDDSGKLSELEKQRLLNEIDNLRTETDIWMGIYITPTLSGERIESAAEKTFKKWELGKKGKDNGLLFLIAIEERKTRIEVGYGLEESVTDLKTGRILRDPGLIHYLKNSNYADASSFVIQKIIEIREGKFKESEPTFLDYPATHLGVKLTLILFVYLILISFWVDQITKKSNLPLGKTKKYLTLKTAIGYFFLCGSFSAMIAAGTHLDEIVLTVLGIIFVILTLILPSTLVLIGKFLPPLPNAETTLVETSVALIVPFIKGIFFTVIVYKLSDSKTASLVVGGIVAIISIFQNGKSGSGKSGGRGSGSGSSSSSSRSSSGGGRSGGGGSSGSW